MTGHGCENQTEAEALILQKEEQMKDFPHGNAGPHDPELVALIIEAVQGYMNNPYESKWLTDNADFLNDLVDNINDIFEPEIIHDRMFHRSTLTVCE